MDKLFFELIQVSLGSRKCLSHTPRSTSSGQASADEWGELYAMAKKQSLVGVCFAGVQRLQSQQQEPPEMLYLTWMGMAAKIQQRNEVVNLQCVELQKRLATDGLKTTILKGQGIAGLYNESLRGLRQSGDIDVLVDCDFVRAAEFAKSSTGINVKWAYKDISLPFFQNTEVELHIKPGLMFNPFHNRAWQDWYKSNKGRVFLPTNGKGFSTPSIEFNLIYILHHCYMHLFESGVGLRQVMDYYFVLRSVRDAENVERVKNVIQDLGMTRFAIGIMWIMREVFGLDEQYLIFEPNEKEGSFLLNEIMQSGNFGKHDDRFERNINNRKEKLKYFFKRSMILVSHYPQEALWMPWYFVWHYLMKQIKR